MPNVQMSKGGSGNGEVAAGANLPPQKAKAKKNARVYGADGDKGGTQRFETPTTERAMAVDRMRVPLPKGKRGENRFPKAERLRKRKEFEACLREGKRFSHPLLNLFVRWHGNEGRRIAFSVGRRVAKKATQRNRLRRWLREAYRTKRWLLKDGMDLFVVAQPACAAANFQAIDNALKELLQRARVLKTNRVDHRQGADAKPHE